MKILIYDYLFVKGHIHPNTHYIKLLAKEHEVSVISVSSIYEELSEEVHIIKIQSKYTSSDIKKNRFAQVSFCKDVLRQVNVKSFDAVLFLSYDTDSFTFAYPMFPSKTLFVLQSHNNIDKLSQNWIHRILFNGYKNKVRHIVYEEFMKDKLVETYKVNPETIFVLPRARFSYEICPTEKSFSAIGLSGSNSDEYIQQLASEADNKSESFKNIRVLLKAHRPIDSKTGIISVINNRVSDQEYKELFNSTRVVLDPLPNTFMYRMSAVLFEALSSRKIVIGSDTKIIAHFSKKYPHICLAAKSPADMLNLIQGISLSETEQEKKEFDRFMIDYSDEKTMMVFNAAFSKS